MLFRSNIEKRLRNKKRFARIYTTHKKAAKRNKSLCRHYQLGVNISWYTHFLLLYYEYYSFHSGSSQPLAVQSHPTLCNTSYLTYPILLLIPTVIVLKGSKKVECSATNRKKARKERSLRFSLFLPFAMPSVSIKHNGP